MEPINPPVDLLTLESLPFDTQKKVALNLPYGTVISLCMTSKKLNKVCKDIYFWKDYFRVQVPVNINVPSGAGISWYKDKIEQYLKFKKITDLLDEGKATRKYIQKFNINSNIFERIQNLRVLYCRNNQLTSLPSMPNLQKLFCDNNRLTSLPLKPNLKYLTCDNNQLTSIPLMPNLEVLNCENNQLTSISPMPNLEELYCEDNQLTSIPSMPNLQKLDCENNPLPGFTLDYWRDMWNKES